MNCCAARFRFRPAWRTKCWRRSRVIKRRQIGNAVYNIPISTASGFDIKFDYATYGGDGADGLAFYLIDGAATPSLGGGGGDVGYRGVTSGYFGIGFTEYRSIEEAVKLWGSGSGGTGFNQLVSVSTSTVTGDRAGAKHVRIVFLNNHISVWLNDNLIIENYDLTAAAGQATLPGTVKIGFSGATGVNYNIHEVDNLVMHVYTPNIRVTTSGSTVWPCGDTWATACALQTALTNARTSDELWVAAGTYKPTTGTDRNATFQLKSGVNVYGGFAGTETARDERDWVTHPIILTGDLNGNDNSNVDYTEPTRADNSYHVVLGVTGATLDGFTVTAGHANGSTSPGNEGGAYITGAIIPPSRTLFLAIIRIFSINGGKSRE